MEDKQFQITITKEDGDLYRLIQECSRDEYAKEQLKLAAELYIYCNAHDVNHEGHYAPHIFRIVALQGKTREELLRIREELVNKVLEYASAFTPDECDCGIRVSPEGERWFIDESGVLGFLTLYSHYIKMVDEELKVSDK